MTKQILMTTLALSVLALPAMAQPGGGDASQGPRGGKMFAKHDANGDGVISQAEFEAQAAERFKTMDADGNGEVTQDEMRAAHEKMKGQMKDRREKRMQKRDGTGDCGASK